MSRKLPANPEALKMRVDRIKNHVRTKSPMMDIPPIIASEFELALHAYYGSRWQMVRALARKALVLWWDGKVGGCLMWISDTVGWTKVYHVPETKDYVDHYRRHGRKCSGSPNCQNMDCINDSLPKWFRRILEWRLR